MRKLVNRTLSILLILTVLLLDFAMVLPSDLVFAEESDSMETKATELSEEEQNDNETDLVDPVSTAPNTEEDFDANPQLLITEISPNSQGGGTDYYEFFEVYNNTNQPLALTNYSFTYRYTDTGNETIFQVPAVTIEPQETMVLWFNNGGNTLADFNANFGVDLGSEQVVEFTSVFPGFANGGNRAIVIKDNEGNEIVSASYLGEDNDNTGADIHYTYPIASTEMVKQQGAAIPTPGTIEANQVPATPVTLPDVVEDEEAPIIDHTPITESSSFSPIQVEATITDNAAVPLATLYYKEAGADNFTSLSMHANAEEPSIYAAEIPSKHVVTDIVYYIEATDGITSEQTEEYTIAVEKVNVDFAAIPPFLVTEVVPDTSNIDGADGYEFIEIYNNSDQAMNFKDYKLNYRYDKDPSRDVVWPSVPEDVVIPAGETLVFWIINAKNGNATTADFNAHYGTDLVEEEDIVKIYSGGMANSGGRGLVVKTNAGKEITVSYYNDEAGVDDTLPNKGIIYKYPEDGSLESMKVSAGLEDATPGAVESFQVPEQAVQVENDTVDPTVENITEVTEADEQSDIHIAADVTDNNEVRSVRLFYKTNKQNEYNNVVLQQDENDGFYHHTIYSPEIIGNEQLTYYFVVTDGVNEVKSETFEISITNDLDQSSLRLNVEDDEIVNGEVILKGTSQADSPDDVNMYIDGKEQVDGIYHSLDRVAYFAYEVNGLNTYFKNAVTMGDEILYMMDQDWLTDWKTFSIPIEPDSLQLGDNTITLRSGNKASPYDLESSENRDNYDLRNVRLVLSDGTILRDPNYTDTTRVIGMNDDNPFEDFTFTIADEHAKAKTYQWDTTTIADGEHEIKVEDKDEEVSSSLLVDNTAPVVETTIVDGEEYKGEFTINVDVTDEIAGMEENVQVLLDGQEITVPYETASSKLTPGEHKLTVIAADNVGNSVEEVIPFSVVSENPDKPELISPADDSSAVVDGNPKLKVKVTDPTQDKMDVAFNQGYKYDFNSKDAVIGYKHAADTEPPQVMVPEGEQAFTTEDIANVSEKDGNYLTTDSDTQFPYHRFDVTVDESVDENDIVELIWQGNSLQGRKVSMYAWNHQANEWTLIDHKIAGEEDFELKGNVTVHEFVKDSKVNVLVQDLIPGTPDEYDYTFVWMSDTQYYSESFPHIFDRQTQWIAEMKEELKIEYVFHTGDLVDEADQEYQWDHADQYMSVLDDNEIPYGVLAGNHDVGGVNNDYTAYYKYFGADRFENKPYYGESYLNNRGHYDLMSAGGNDYIMVYLGWDVTDEGIAWVNEVLAAHPNRKAILNFHEYLLATGTRHPLGEKLYNEIVVPNENVIAVFSGHYHEAQTLIDEIDDNGDGTADRKVYQLLADYQAGPEGGQGYMRLLHFDQDNNRIMVNTYSPYMDDYNFFDTDEYPGKDEFMIELDLSVQEKRVATDYFAVHVYSDTEIGTVANVPSGEGAEMTWTGLDEGRTYSWYTIATDQFTGETRSDMWTFVKGENNANVPEKTYDLKNYKTGKLMIHESNVSITLDAASEIKNGVVFTGENATFHGEGFADTTVTIKPKKHGAFVDFNGIEVKEVIIERDNVEITGDENVRKISVK